MENECHIAGPEVRSNVSKSPVAKMVHMIGARGAVIMGDISWSQKFPAWMSQGCGHNGPKVLLQKWALNVPSILL